MFRMSHYESLFHTLAASALQHIEWLSQEALSHSERGAFLLICKSLSAAVGSGKQMVFWVSQSKLVANHSEDYEPLFAAVENYNPAKELVLFIGIRYSKTMTKTNQHDSHYRIYTQPLAKLGSKLSGAIVLRGQEAFRALVAPEECGRKGCHAKQRLRSCYGCRSIKYCSKVCQKKDWLKIHKNLCKILAQARSEGKRTLV